MGELVPVPVPGADDLMATRDGDKTWVSLRHMCDLLEVSYPAQMRKLEGRSWATVALKATVAGDGRTREMVMVDSETVPMWLATLDENRVAPEARPKLIAYQREARHALDSYFNKRAVTVPAVNQFDVLRAAIDQIEAAQRTADEAKKTADRTEARLDGIEGRHDWFSALGYARYRGLPTGKTFLQVLGRRAAALARAEGVTPENVQHAHYGTVNSLPLWVWDTVAGKKI